MTFNEKLALATLDAIQADKEHWYQSVWRDDLSRITDDRCGTGMCFAGFAITVDGCRWAGKPGQETGDLLLARKDDLSSAVFGYDGKQVVTARSRAQRVLGLSDNQSTELFDADNDLPTLKRLIKQYAKESS